VLAAHSLAIGTASLLPPDRLTAILATAGLDVISGPDEHPRGHAQEPFGDSLKHGDERTDRPPTRDGGCPRSIVNVFHDLGNLQLAFLMVAMYFAFSQFLIIWSGNLPTEITWYMRRLSGGWQVVALALVVLNFAVPFLSLFSRDVKRSPRRLARVALLVLTMYGLYIYWIIVPAFTSAGLRWHATNVAALAALGGLWLMLFCWNTRRNLARLPASE
jgi:hypothetical protein